MKHYSITLDTGTTNTRVLLFDENRNIVARRSSETGVRNTAIDGNNSRLKSAVKSCLQGVLEDAEIGYDSVDLLVASGMITSNVGLVEVPHLTVPVGKAELAAGIRSQLLPEIAALPIAFIPGVKNAVQPVRMENFEQMDIMRGEEVETIALIEGMRGYESLLVVLPGSHTKFVSVNRAGQITGCLTTITGELLSCVTHNTIIADAVNRRFVSEETYDRELLLSGYRQAAAVGIGRACFSCRILSQFLDKNPDRLANYILGAVLQNDLIALRHSSAIQVRENTRVVVAGRNPLRRAFADLLQEDGFFRDVREDRSAQEVPLSARGALDIAKAAGLGAGV
jgi:2-dehydro-3-deoxygalactonokinase